MTDTTPDTPHRRFRLSLATRLGMGFAVIAVVLLLGHSAAQRDMRSAIETLLETQTAQVPLSRIADTLTYQVVAFDRAVLADVRSPTGANRISVAEAQVALFSSLDGYADLRPSAADEIADFRLEVEEHAGIGWSLIDAGEQRQVTLNDLRDVLDLLTRRISTAFRLDSQLPDPALSRRAYADLELDLGRLRAALNSYLVSGPEASGTSLPAATRDFRSTVTRHRNELRRSPGRAWLELVEEDLGRVEQLQRDIRRHDASIEALRARFAESGLRLPLRLDAALAAPASRAVADSAGSAADAARSAELAIRQLTYLVLGVTLLVSLLTMLAVTRPVRRLTLATRALASGGHHVRVPPGGSLELDELGRAFNQMARQLAEADLKATRHRHELEDRVRARTLKLTHLANHDPLTELPNRRCAFNHLRRAVREATLHGTSIGLIALDVDNFKVINDNFGHSVGDVLLRGVADRLRMVVGESQFVARLGGDEFVVAMEDANPFYAAAEMAESIVSAFRAPLKLGDRDILVSVSVGVASLPDHASDVGGLVRAADAALFRAKELGRNRIATFSHDLLEGAETRFALEQSLRRAVESRELVLVYQPQVSLADGSTDVVEALLRWKPDGGPMMSASEFISIAEQSGLIIEVGYWVIDTAAAAVADWRSRGFDTARVAINVSVNQLLDRRFVSHLMEVLERHDLPADAIELELTETAFQTSSATIEALRRLSERGLGLALDDFGTGYSSLTSLSRLPLRRVKIDRSLVCDAPASPRAESLARSIIGVCHNLGLGVTVEGIERPEQLAWLSGCGPVHAQGYLIARPMTAAEVPHFASRSAALLADALGRESPRSAVHRVSAPVVPLRYASRPRVG